MGARFPAEGERHPVPTPERLKHQTHGHPYEDHGSLIRVETAKGLGSLPHRRAKGMVHNRRSDPAAIPAGTQMRSTVPMNMMAEMRARPEASNRSSHPLTLIPILK